MEVMEALFVLSATLLPMPSRSTKGLGKSNIDLIKAEVQKMIDSFSIHKNVNMTIKDGLKKIKKSIAAIDGESFVCILHFFVFIYSIAFLGSTELQKKKSTLIVIEKNVNCMRKTGKLNEKFRRDVVYDKKI